MSSRSSMAARLNLICIGFGLLVCILIGTLMVAEKYKSTLNTIMMRAQHGVDDNLGQQFALYFGDRAVLQDYLDNTVNQELVDYIVVRDAAGAVLAEKRASPAIVPPDMQSSRDALASGTQSKKIQLDGRSVLNMEIPVYGYIDPLRVAKDSPSYDSAFKNYHGTNSRYLFGSMQLGVNLDAVSHSLIPYGKGLVTTLLIFFLLYSSLVFLVVRKITQPISRLAEFARDITGGRLDRPINVQGAGEIVELAHSLNTVVEELNKHKSQVEVDNKLLSMKVAERTEQLTRRNEELNDAVAKISRTENRLKQLAYYDSLTSLPNRQLFLERLEELMVQVAGEGELLALLFMDLDNFKRINDSLGHNIGDQLLKAVADRLAHCLRASDFLANFSGSDSGSSLGISRLGGDEFTVLLKNIEHTDNAMKIAQRILETMRDTFLIEGHELVVTPSIGISIAPRDANTVEELVKMADTAMYHAKKAGKNTYKFYSRDMVVANVSRLKVETDLRRAIERGEISLYFQPQLDMNDGQVVGTEALLRWQHPQRGFIPPTEFIPLAEEMGLIAEIGNWVIREACLKIIEIQKLGLQAPIISVNVSSLQFTPSFSQQVAKIIKETGIGPEMLMMELTEGILLSQADHVIDTLFRLKTLGIQLAIDDFGTGYSSLSYLAKFPIDELKIDRSFVIEIGDPDNTHSRSLIDAIVAMAKTMNLEVVAEGVDNQLQLDYLIKNGVDVIQGYLFSKPLPFDDYVLFLQNNPFIGTLPVHPKMDASINIHI